MRLEKKFSNLQLYFNDIELVQLELIRNSRTWENTNVAIGNIQILIFYEDNGLEHRMRQREVDLVAFESSESEPTMDQMSAIYRYMAVSEKWTGFRKRLDQACTDFNLAKIVWSKPIKMWTLRTTLQEMNIKVKQSDRIASYWTSKFERFRMEWGTIKAELEICIQDCAQFAHCLHQQQESGQG